VLTSWYFWRVTGNPLRMPAREYMLQNAASPMFIWQAIPTEPAYRDTVLREAHVAFRFDREQFLTLNGTLRYTAWKLLRIGTFYLGPLILLPLVTLPLLWRSRWRFLLIATSLTLSAVLVVVPMQIHYAAPLTAAFYALAVQSIRLLWIAGKRGNPLGQFLSAGAPAAVFIVLTLAFITEPPRTLLLQRAEMEEALFRSGGKHLVIVRYSSFHNLAEEWVYNVADIDGSPVVWARDKGARNRDLTRYYPDRKAWLLEADTRPVILSPYSQ
jgi:hypothetical protein